jgi:formate--tetrahydrofolate ligase
MALSDIQIAQAANAQTRLAHGAGASRDSRSALEPYGHYKAKIDLAWLDRQSGPRGKLVLVTAISPTPAGEGKTTTVVGLGDALNRIGKRCVIALREPSLGPVFGMKGGAAGGGHAQVVPMEDINLHFTGDFNAIALAHNLLAALIDNHIHHGNALGFDLRRIVWRRVMDMNDRALRSTVIALGGPGNGFPREDGFRHRRGVRGHGHLLPGHLAARSEGAAGPDHRGLHPRPETDSRRRPAGARRDGGAAEGRDQAEPGADAGEQPGHHPRRTVCQYRPWLQFRHRHLAALKLGDYVVTEAGFGADLGAEKFIDIKCRKSGSAPRCAVVIVATLRALKYHGGVDLKDLNTPDPAAVEKGLPNLERHVDNIRHRHGLPCVVSINHFTSDTEPELDLLRRHMERQGVPVVVARHWAEGSAGAEELAHAVVRLAESGTAQMRFVYEDEDSLWDKMKAIATQVYGASDISADSAVRARIARSCSRMVTVTTRCVWPRRNIRSRPTPSCVARPSATWSIFAKCAWPPGPSSW